MKKEDMVSVIVPAYNLEDYIEKCIESIRKQTYQNIEIIIVDDGSVDNTYKICEKIAKNDSRIKLLKQKNQGVVAARDKGLQIAKGYWILFVDGDDWIEEEMISYMVRNIGTADMVTVGAYQEKNKGEIIRWIDKYEAGIYSGYNQMQQIYKKMLYDKEKKDMYLIIPVIWNKLFIKEKAKQIHGELSKELVIAEDMVFLYRYLLECQEIVITHDSFYHYQYRDGSAFHKVNTHILRDISNVYNELLPWFEQQDEELELVFQLKKWFMIFAISKIKDMLSDSKEIRISEYIPNIKGINEEKIVLYGAGRVGKDYYRYFKETQLNVVLWADKRYEVCQKEGLPVSAPDEINKIDFDLIYIAIEQEREASLVKDELYKIIKETNKIIWKPPIRWC